MWIYGGFRSVLKANLCCQVFDYTNLSKFSNQHNGETVLCFAKAYGFRNIQTIITKMKVCYGNIFGMLLECVLVLASIWFSSSIDVLNCHCCHRSHPRFVSPLHQIFCQTHEVTRGPNICRFQFLYDLYAERQMSLPLCRDHGMSEVRVGSRSS